jgi:hypothetical protein
VHNTCSPTLPVCLHGERMTAGAVVAPALSPEPSAGAPAAGRQITSLNPPRAAGAPTRGSYPHALRAAS